MIRVQHWILILAGVLVLGAPAGAQRTTSASALLESASQKATLEGDLHGAIKIYQDVATRFAKSDRPAAATALLKMADCYEKLGDPQAGKILEQIVSQYADQAAAAAARARMSSGMPRMICEECGDPLGSVSPDGRVMATVMPYLNGGDRFGDVGLLDLSTNKLTPLQIEGSGKGATGVALATVFSPDGRQIVYAWSAGQSARELRIVPREPGGKMRALPNAGGYEFILPFGWAKAGILAAAQKKDQAPEFIIVAPADGAQTVIKPMSFRMSSGVRSSSLSADGRFIAYEQFIAEQSKVLNPRQAAMLDRQIHVLAVDGSSDVAITTGAGIKKWASWTPNGSHVVYLSNVAGAWDLWATPMRDGKPSGEPVLVKKNAGDVQRVGMSTTGQYFFYEGRTGVFRSTILPVTPGTARASASADGFIGTLPAWSPDGKAIAINRPRPDGVAGSDVVVRTVATGDERVFRHEGILGFPTMWFPEGAGLLVQVREAPNSVFWYRLNIASGEFVKLVQQRGSPAFWTHQNVRTLSADGRTLFFGTYANQVDQQLDRITALDLASGSYRDVARLPLDKESQPRGAQDFVLAASPDGRWLAMMLRDHKLNAARLAVVGVDGQGYREPLPPVQAVYLRNKLAWSRDGRWIYFTTQSGKPDDDLHRVMRVPAAGGAAEPVGLEAAGLDGFDLSPDGTRIAFSTLRPEGWGQLLWSLDVSWLMKAAR